MEITPSFLREIIDYNPETGEMTWRVRTPDTFRNSKGSPASHRCDGFNTQFAGRPALSYAVKGRYKVGSIFGKHLYAHRVAWAIYYGEWPKHHVDHINGNKHDNRISNLRDCTHSMNLRNSPAKVKTASGQRCIYNVRGKWMVRFCLKSGATRSRLFINLEDAIKERNAMAERLGFTNRHFGAGGG